MSLFSGARRFLFLRFVRGLLKDVEAGKYGEECQTVLKWLKANKTKVGLVVSFIAGGLAAVDQTEAAAIVTAIATFLIGAGGVSSDKEQRARQ